MSIVTQALSNKRSNASVSMMRVAGLVSCLVLCMMLAAPVHALQAYNMPVGVTEISQKVFDLHMLIYWICVVIGVIVFGAMLYSCLLYTSPSPRDRQKSRMPSSA